MTKVVPNNQEDPVDWQLGLETFGGDEQIFRCMLTNFETMCFDQNINKSYQSMKQQDFKSLKGEAHTLKGSSAYIGAQSFSAVCFELQKESQKLYQLIENQIEKYEPTNAINTQDIIQIFINYMKEAKILKIHLQKLLGNPDQEFEQYDEYNTQQSNTQSGQAKSQCCVIF